MADTGRATKKLFVEGNDDLHVIVHLARKLRAAWGAKAEDWFGGFRIEDSGSDDGALRNFALALKSSAPSHAGLVLDADDQPGKRAPDRWAAATRVLAPHGATLPPHLPANGWQGQTRSGVTAGVWVMPDNQASGALEALLIRLVADDGAWGHARQAAQQAALLGAPFAAHYLPKAQLHTWLAWREQPGRPYGRAVEAGDLDPKRSPTPALLVEWLERVFR